jgi:hypothetical protein
MSRRLTAGDRVIVPFGLHDLEATVLRVSETGLGMRVTVEIHIEGTDEPFITTYRADQVSTVAAA